MPQNKIVDSDFPSLFQVADGTSINSQICYTRLIRADLILLVIGALLSSITVENPEIKMWMNIVGAILLLLAFFISLGLRFTRYEKVWYGGRAVAESVKTISWRYMTTAEPFSSNLAAADVDQLFTNRLQEILTERRNLAVDFAENMADQISQRMKTVRALSFADRKEVYLRDRVREQRSWYSTKSGLNRSSEQKFFWFAIVIQFIAFALAAYQIKNPNALNLAAVFAAGTTSIFSWMQIRKFQELAQVYALTAQELGFVDARSTAVTNDQELSSFVSDSENAISREHTMWVARRDH